MSTRIYAGSLQRTSEYQTRGLRTLHGVRWTFQTQGHIHFPPLVSHDMVYLGSNDGCFYALGTHTGIPQWRFETECVSLPIKKDVRMDDLKYTGVTSVQLTESTAFFGTANRTIYGLDLETGRQTWQFVREEPKIEPESLVIRIDGEREIEIKGPPGIFHMIVVDDLLLFWSESGLSAVDVTTKERLWLEKQLSPFTESLTQCPTIADQMLYGINNFIYMHSHDIDSGIYAYDLSTNAYVWDHGFSFSDDPNAQGGYEQHCANGIIPVANGTAYFLAWTPEVEAEDEEEEDDEGSTCLVAVDARTGTPQWSFVLEQERGYEGYTALANNLVYAVQIDGNIFAIDLVTHKARWTRQFEGDAFKKEYAPPSLADGVLYLPRRDGLIIALDALTGQDLWRVQIDGEITTPCTIADGVVYVAAGATVYALH